MITKIFRAMSNEETSALLRKEANGRPIEFLKNHLIKTFLNTSYREDTLHDVFPNNDKKKNNKPHDFLKQLSMAFSFEKTEIESIFANGFEFSARIGGGSYPCDTKAEIPDRVAFDIKSISYNPKTEDTKSGESSLSQNFTGNLDNEFSFTEESCEEIINLYNNSQDFSQHPRIVQLNRTLHTRFEGIFEKFKKVRLDDEKTKKMYYILIVKNNFNFIILGLELFPDLSEIDNDFLKILTFDDYMLSGVKYYDDKSLISSLKKFHSKKEKIVNFKYNSDLFEMTDYIIDICLYKSKKRIELRVGKIPDNILTIRVNPTLHDINSLLYNFLETYFKDKFKNRYNWSIIEQNLYMNHLLENLKQNQLDLYEIKGFI